MYYSYENIDYNKLYQSNIIAAVVCAIIDISLILVALLAPLGSVLEIVLLGLSSFIIKFAFLVAVVCAIVNYKLVCIDKILTKEKARTQYKIMKLQQ